MIHINDGIVWFCEIGVNGCSTMPIKFLYISVMSVLVTLIVGILIGKRLNAKSVKEVREDE